MSVIFSLRGLLTVVLCGLAVIVDSTFRLGWLRLGAQLATRIYGAMPRWRWSRSRGARVSRISAGSPAEKAGLQIGDVIVRFAGNNIQNSEQLKKFVAAARAGIDAQIEVLRAGRVQSFNVTLGAPIPSARTAEVIPSTRSCSTAQVPTAANQGGSAERRSARRIQSR